MTDDTLPSTNAETLFSGRPNLIDTLRNIAEVSNLMRASEHGVTHLIDLQKRYDIVTTQNLYLPPSQRYETIDRVTFDGDPESRYHIVGRGATAAESVRDLLDQMAEVAANE